MNVALFVTCLVDQLFPQVGVSTVRLLRRLGCRVTFPEQQTCCGQPAWNSGYPDDARAGAAGLLDAFEDADCVVSPSGSCCGMVHHAYGELFQHDPALAERAARLVAKSHELTSFIVNVLGRADVGARFPHKVTYHPSCHGTRLLGVGPEPLRLLQNVRELSFAPLPRAEDCCGFGGTFAVKLAAISGAMADEKAECVESTGAEFVVGTDMGCLMNLGGRLKSRGSKIRTLHVAELLDRGLALAAEGPGAG